MYGRKEPPARLLTRESFQDNEDFLYGVDLFNAGYYWEAHTFWERLWAIEETEPGIRSFLQALIQMAAACLKVRLGQIEGARKLLHRAQRNRGRGLLPGIDLDAIERDVHAFIEGSAEPPLIALRE